MNISLCLIHGWAVNAHIFTNFCHLLPSTWQISTPNLLGHGSNHEPFTITDTVKKIAAKLNQPTFLFGWSLGGLIALHIAAQYPNRVKGLILSNTFARFQAALDYPQGVNLAKLQRMTEFFQQNYAQSVRQFLELQLLYTPNCDDIIKTILPDIVQHGTPTALHTALQAIEQADARNILSDIQCPSLLLYGGKDTITPPRMGEYLAQYLPNATLQIQEKAAHTPFLSHANWCVTHITQWINHINNPN